MKTITKTIGLEAHPGLSAAGSSLPGCLLEK
jgi:hypothetical protein